MNKPRASTLGIPAAVIGAAAITTLSVWLLSMLNARAMPSTPAPQPVRTVMIRRPPVTPAQRPQRSNQPEATPAPPENMTPRLDMPLAVPVTLPPLHLDLELPPPEIDPVAISIHQPPQVQPLEMLKPETSVEKIVAEATPRRRAETVLPTQPAVPTRPSLARTSQTPHRSTRPTSSVARRQSAQVTPNVPTSTSVGPVVHRADKVDRPPREGYGNTEPTYPARERNLGIEGSVLVKLLIDEQGRVQDAKVLRGPEAFRRPVLAVVYDWQFTPAQHDGRPVKVWGVKEVQFRLRVQ